jgi:hypothetical protein
MSLQELLFKITKTDTYVNVLDKSWATQLLKDSCTFSPAEKNIYLNVTKTETKHLTFKCYHKAIFLEHKEYSWSMEYS